MFEIKRLGRRNFLKIHFWKDPHKNASNYYKIAFYWLNLSEAYLLMAIVHISYISDRKEDGKIYFDNRKFRAQF